MQTEFSASSLQCSESHDPSEVFFLILLTQNVLINDKK